MRTVQSPPSLKRPSVIWTWPNAAIVRTIREQHLCSGRPGDPSLPAQFAPRSAPGRRVGRSPLTRLPDCKAMQFQGHPAACRQPAQARGVPACRRRRPSCRQETPSPRPSCAAAAAPSSVLTPRRRRRRHRYRWVLGSSYRWLDKDAIENSADCFFRNRWERYFAE